MYPTGGEWWLYPRVDPTKLLAGEQSVVVPESDISTCLKFTHA